MEYMNNMKMFTLQELAEDMGVNVETVRRYIRAGKLKGVKVGTRNLVSEESYTRFLNGEKSEK